MENKNANAKETEHVVHRQCPNCGYPEQIVWVHGHGQCVQCKMNIMPCCDGEQCLEQPT